jgi:hypothetical protein
MSPDARAVVRAADALTTQVRRIADARQSDFALTPDAADDARRIRTALQTPSYVLNTTAVVPAWRHNPDGTWSLTVGEGVLTVPPSTSPARRAQFLLAYISLSAGGWTVRPTADASGHSSNYEGPPLAEETP